MNTTKTDSSPFEQLHDEAWRKRRDEHFERWLNEEIEVTPKDFALTIAFGGLVCFVGAGLWYGVYCSLRWLAHAFLF